MSGLVHFINLLETEPDIRVEINSGVGIFMIMNGLLQADLLLIFLIKIDQLVQRFSIGLDDIMSLILSLFASVKLIHKINTVGFWSLAGCIIVGQFIVMCFLNVILVIVIVLYFRVILFVGLFFGMEGVLSETELVLVEIFHPVLVFSEGFRPHFLHWGVVFACLLILAKVESVGRFKLILMVIGIILMVIGVILGVWVSLMGRDFGVELVFVGLSVFFFGFELAGLKLVDPDPMCLELKYPLGMWVLLIAVKDVGECLIEIFWG